MAELLQGAEQAAASVVSPPALTWAQVHDLPRDGAEAGTPISFESAVAQAAALLNAQWPGRVNGVASRMKLIERSKEAMPAHFVVLPSTSVTSATTELRVVGHPMLRTACEVADGRSALSSSERRAMAAAAADSALDALPPPSRVFTECTECAICLEALSSGGKVQALPCGHPFHREPCLRGLIAARQTRCPLCRAGLEDFGGGAATLFY